MANIICCYTTLQPEVLEALQENAPFCNLLPANLDIHAYWRNMHFYWRGREDLVNIEHDIVIGPDTVSDLLTCDEDWCVYGYQHGCPPPSHGHLGCVKFSAALQRRILNPEQPDCGYCTPPDLCWMHLDNTLERVLMGAGFRQHYHGEVSHLQWAFRKLSNGMTDEMQRDYGLHAKLTIIRNRGEFNAEDYLKDYPPRDG